MPRCYQLVGVPASGKSSWISAQIWALGLTVASTDTFVQAYADQQGRTYSEVFDEYMPQAVNLMTNVVVHAREHEHDVIWDQTSTTVASRARKFRMLPNYEHIAVVFQTPDEEEHTRRLKTRPGKIIPEAVLHDMVWNFEMPTEQEGFKEIWYAQ